MLRVSRRLLWMVWWTALWAVLATSVVASPAGAQTGAAVLEEAAAALRRDPVFVHPGAERAISARDAERLRDKVRDSGRPVFIAVLPAAAINEAGGDASAVPAALATRTGLSGTYAVVAGTSFRAASNDLPGGAAGRLATSAFQSRRDQGTTAVLSLFVDRVEAARGGSGGSGGGRSDDGGGSRLGLILLLAAVGAVGFFVLRSRRRRREEDRIATRELAADRQVVQAELSVLAEDVMALEPQVTMHTDARPDYDAAVTRYRAAAAALEYADDEVDLVRVRRVLVEGQYAMARARAIIEGRDPPLPPPELQVRGRHDEPPIEVDEYRQPVYVGGGGPFYGGGWFGMGGSFLGGLLLGNVLSGGMGGWGGGWGGGGHDGGGGSDIGGGDWGGSDFGGGDFGGGDFGGGGDW